MGLLMKNKNKSLKDPKQAFYLIAVYQMILKNKTIMETILQTTALPSHRHLIKITCHKLIVCHQNGRDLIVV